MLVLVTASVGSWVLQATASARSRFFSSNALPAVERKLWLVDLFGISVVCATACAVFAFTKANAGDKLARAARTAAPLLLAWSLPALLTRGPWKEAELEYLILLGTVLLCLEPLLALSLRETRACDRLSALAERARVRAPRFIRWAPRLLVLAALAYYAVRIGQLTLLSHERMATSTADLGQFDNLFFNALHGHPFRAPAMTGKLTDWSTLNVHAELVLYALLPFYALAPGPHALLVMQSSAIALSAIPVYLLAAARIGRPSAVICAVAVLLLPAVQRPNFYDFHFPPFGMLFVLWTLYFADRVVRTSAIGNGRNRTALAGLSVFFVLALLTREEFSIGLLLVGVMVSIARPERGKLGLALAGCAALYLVVMKFLVMPSFGASWFDAIYEDLKASGSTGFRAVVATGLTNPAYIFQKLPNADNLQYVLHLSVPLALLWWRRAWLLLAAVPGILFTLLVTNRAPMGQVNFQYVYFWIPYVVAASVYGLRHLLSESRERFLAASMTLAFGAFCASYQFGALLGNKAIVGGFGPKQLSISEEERARAARARELVRRIPAEASVAATEQEGPWVSTRLDLFSLASFGDADYLFLGRVRDGEEKNRVRGALRSGLYGLEARSGEFTLLRKGADPSRNAELLKTVR